MRARRKDALELEHNSDIQAGFEIGYIYHNVKQELNHIGAASGGKITAAHAAAWLGKLLLSEARRSLLDGAEPVPKMRREAASRHEKPAAAAKVHVHARDQQTLKFPRAPVTCRLCNTTLPNRRKYMLHRNRAHPEEQAKQVAAMNRAKRRMAKR
jgi:hypothetical protein